MGMRYGKLYVIVLVLLLVGVLSGVVFALTRSTVVKTLASFTTTDGAMSWSPDGTKIASMRYPSGRSDDSKKELFVGDARTGEILASKITFSEANTEGGMIVWSPDGTKLAVKLSWTSNSVIVVDSHTLETLMYIKAFSHASLHGRVSEISWSPDGKKIALVGGHTMPSAGYVEVVDTTTYTVLFIHQQMKNAYSISWSPSSQYFTVGDNGSVQVWNAISYKQLLTYRVSGEYLHGASWQNNELIVSRGTTLDIRSVETRSEIRIWNAFSGVTVKTVSIHKSSDASHEMRVLTASLSPDGHLLLVSYRSKDITGAGKDLFYVSVIDMSENTTIATYSDKNERIDTIRWSPNGDLIASEDGPEKDISIWSLTK